MICHRCGKCCYFMLLNGRVMKCPFLVRFGKITVCRIYSQRLERIIYSDGINNFKCVPIEMVGCKYGIKNK